MLRTIITTGAAMLLSLAFLAACEVDTTDDADGDNGADDVEETTTEDEETDETETVTEEEDESDDTATEEESTEAATEEEDDSDAETPTGSENGETDESGTPEDEADETATSDEESEGTGESDESAAGDAIEVTLSEYEIDVESPLESGEAVLSVTNESEGLLGLAIERGSGTDEENGDDEDSAEVIHAINVEGGETRELEVELEAGEYTFFCPIGELRETEDMETDVTVE